MPFKYNFERLYRSDNIYDIILVLNFNLNPVQKNKGSAIFIHIAKRNYKIDNVIIGGTNLAGCVLRSKPYSAIHWAKKGYHTQILWMQQILCWNH